VIKTINVLGIEVITDNLDAEIIYILGLHKKREEFLTRANIIKVLKTGKVRIRKNTSKRKNNYDRTDELQHKLRFCASDNFQYFSNDDTVRNRIDKMIELGLVLQSGSVKTTGAPGKMIKLSTNGEFIYDIIEKVYPALEILPEFGDDFVCEYCEQDIKDSCLTTSEDYLESYLSEFYPQFSGLTGKEILGDSYSLKSLKEFLFWIVMNNSAKQILELKYPILFPTT
jgi:hypothetical protein